MTMSLMFKSNFKCLVLFCSDAKQAKIKSMLTEINK